jgi:hypothetical protein
MQTTANTALRKKSRPCPVCIPYWRRDRPRAKLCGVSVSAISVLYRCANSRHPLMLVSPQAPKKNAATRQSPRSRWRAYVAATGIMHTLAVLGLVLYFTPAHVAEASDQAPTGALGGDNRSVAKPGTVRIDLREAAQRGKGKKPEDATPPSPSPAPVSAAEQARRNKLMDRLVAAYPAFLTGHTDNELIWRDGARMPFDDGRVKDFETRLTNSDIEDQFSVAYPAGPMLSDPEPEFDPGRFRNDAFFAKMYGDCRKHGVEKQLVDVVWLPKHGGKKIKITAVNGVAEKLQAASNELDALPAEFQQYLQPIAGTYNCRVIAGTDRLSAHGLGFAIDLNAKYSDYWQWQKGHYAYRNRVPWEIAAIFEKHGFIWGAKWYHYDSMHFEYRPELLSGGDDAPDENAPVPLPEKQRRNLD